MICSNIKKRLNMRLIPCFLLWAVACVLLTSCFGNKAPQRTYFSVDYALSTQPRYQAPKYQSSVVIQNITSTLAYDRQEIVYRSNPYEFEYYWYRLWASKPKKMLNELILGHLQYTNIFKSVTTNIEDKLPDYMLDVYIVSIEELDVSETEWYAHLSLKFTLSRSTDSSIVWTYTFDAKRPVANNQPVYVVKAMSEMLDAELTKAFEDLDKKLYSIENSKPATPAADAIDFSQDNQNNDEINTTQSKPENDNVPSASLKNKPSKD